MVVSRKSLGAMLVLFEPCEDVDPRSQIMERFNAILLSRCAKASATPAVYSKLIALSTSALLIRCPVDLDIPSKLGLGT